MRYRDYTIVPAERHVADQKVGLIVSLVESDGHSI